MTMDEVIALGHKLDKTITGSKNWLKYYDILDSEENRIFVCDECGEKCTYPELENWLCHLPEHCICSFCYENNMGEDL